MIWLISVPFAVGFGLVPPLDLSTQTSELGGRVLFYGSGAPTRGAPTDFGSDRSIPIEIALVPTSDGHPQGVPLRDLVL